MQFFRILYPHALSIIIFALTAYFYVKPSFDNKTTQATDAVQYTAMVKAMDKERQENPNKIWPKWNRGMFSGMPFYFAHTEWDPIAGKIFTWINPIFNIQFFNTLHKNPYFAYFFAACLSFYFLTQILRVHFLVGIFSSLAFSYSTHMPILAIAGHHIKILSIALMPYVLACVILIWNRKYWWGATLGVLSLGALFGYNHFQIVYYCLIVIFFISLAYLIHTIIDYRKIASANKTFPYAHIVVSGFIIVVIIAAAVGRNAGTFLATKDYATVSTRSGSTLEHPPTNHADPAATTLPKDAGTGRDYAFNWSLMPSETLTFLSPNIYGAGSNGILNESSNAYRILHNQYRIDEANSVNIVQNLSTYWGEQPFTVGPIYFGVIICFLFVLSLFVYRSWHLYWIGGVSVFAVLIAWGKYFPLLNDFLYYHLPLYNKFRTPSMALCIPQLTFPLLGALGCQRIFFEDIDKKNLLTALKRSVYVFGGVFVILLLFYVSASYSDPQKDAEVANMLSQISNHNTDFIRTMQGALREDRKEIFRVDIYRFMVYITIAVGLLYGFARRGWNGIAAICILFVISVVDLIAVDQKYLSHDSFRLRHQEDEEGEKSLDNFFPLRQADRLILQDRDPNYRVLDLSQNSPFTTATPSYYHRNIGGYYPAKLSIYQDLIDSQITRMNPRVLSMLNTKYIIAADKSGEIFVTKMQPLGAAWFVEKVIAHRSNVEELQALSTFNPKQEAVMEKKFFKQITDKLGEDPHATITSTLSRSDTMKYTSRSAATQLAVFSEVYCDKGWRAWIDNKEVPILKANFALRALVIPAGEHQIEFIFHPTIFQKTKPMQLASAIFCVIALCGLLIFEGKSILAFLASLFTETNPTPKRVTNDKMG